MFQSQRTTHTLNPRMLNKLATNEMGINHVPGRGTHCIKSQNDIWGINHFPNESILPDLNKRAILQGALNQLTQGFQMDVACTMMHDLMSVWVVIIILISTGRQVLFSGRKVQHREQMAWCGINGCSRRRCGHPSSSLTKMITARVASNPRWQWQRRRHLIPSFPGRETCPCTCPCP
jgi:hypothetical protein